VTTTSPAAGFRAAAPRKEAAPPLQRVRVRSRAKQILRYQTPAKSTPTRTGRITTSAACRFPVAEESNGKMGSIALTRACRVNRLARRRRSLGSPDGLKVVSIKESPVPRTEFLPGTVPPSSSKSPCDHSSRHPLTSLAQDDLQRHFRNIEGGSSISARRSSTTAASTAEDECASTRKSATTADDSRPLAAVEASTVTKDSAYAFGYIKRAGAAGSVEG